MDKLELTKQDVALLVNLLETSTLSMPMTAWGGVLTKLRDSLKPDVVRQANASDQLPAQKQSSGPTALSEVKEKK